MSAATLAVAIWGAALSTLLGGLTLLDRRRSRRRVVQVEARVFYRSKAGGYVVGLNIAATNLSERAVGLRQWFLEDQARKVLLAGSPHEGHVGTMLQPHQLHGWNIEPEILQTAELQPPVRVAVTLTTGERIEAGLISW
jgi:hypothetical protein